MINCVGCGGAASFSGIFNPKNGKRVLKAAGRKAGKKVSVKQAQRAWQQARREAVRTA